MDIYSHVHVYACMILCIHMIYKNVHCTHYKTLEVRVRLFLIYRLFIYDVMYMFALILKSLCMLFLPILAKEWTKRYARK